MTYGIVIAILILALLATLFAVIVENPNPKRSDPEVNPLESVPESYTLIPPASTYSAEQHSVDSIDQAVPLDPQPAPVTSESVEDRRESTSDEYVESAAVVIDSDTSEPAEPVNPNSRPLLSETGDSRDHETLDEGRPSVSDEQSALAASDASESEPDTTDHIDSPEAESMPDAVDVSVHREPVDEPIVSGSDDQPESVAPNAFAPELIESGLTVSSDPDDISSEVEDTAPPEPIVELPAPLSDPIESEGLAPLQSSYSQTQPLMADLDETHPEVTAPETEALDPPPNSGEKPSSEIVEIEELFADQREESTTDEPGTSEPAEESDSNPGTIGV